MPTQQRPITAREYRRLGEIGVLGEKVELVAGWIVHGRFRFAFSDEAVAAAREIGIDLADPVAEPSGQVDSASIDAVVELTLRLTRVMRADYVRRG